MADDFDPSPRSSKRRKTGTYGVGRTILQSQEKPSALSNVTGAWSNISKRLFGSSKKEEPRQVHDDSAYASKEDSLNEDGIVGLQDEDMDVEGCTEKMDVVEENALQTTRLKRKSALIVKNIETTAGNGDDNAAESGRGRKTRSSQGAGSVTAGDAISEQSKARFGPKRQQLQDATLRTAELQLENNTNDCARRRNNRGIFGVTQHLDDVEIEESVLGDPSEAASTTDKPEDTIEESQPRSTGRERRRPRRFSIEPISTEKPKTAPKKTAAAKQAETFQRVAEKVLSPQPKGILTPSRHKRGGPRKSVVFDEGEKQIEEQLGFRDIETSTKKPKKQTPKAKPTAGVTEPTTNASPSTSGLPMNLPKVQDDDLLFESNQPADILKDLNLDSIGDPPPIPTADVEDNEHLTTIKSTILSRLTSSTNSPIAHLPIQYATLHALISSTITTGESNSLLLLGSRGSGKSLLLNTALADLSSKHANDFHTVRLNGFFQTDDKLALREIWRQLGREMAVPEEETGEVSSYADTMASLLSLLSHPEELDDAAADAMDVDGGEPGLGAKAAKSVVFILDEFDLFTTHPRQTLLYNLFDIAQSRKAPIAVIGCSTRMDVVECLEKRVKSRFSHRWVYVPSMKSLVAFQEAVESVLYLAEDGSEVLNLTKIELEWRERWNAYIKTFLIPSPSFQSALKQIFQTTKSLPDLLSTLYIPIATLSVCDTPENQTKTTNTLIAPAPNPTLPTLLPTLPTLHLTLLIAAARLDAIHNLAALNFPLVYAHYAELVARTRLQRSAAGMVSGAGLRLWGKEAGRAAWEELGVWEVLVPVSGAGKGDDGGSGGGDGPGGSGNAGRMWRVDVSLEEVEWAVKEKLGGVGVGEVLGRWCREMVL